jgi:KGK domain
VNNQSQQIIPDSQAVIKCLDREMLEKLDSHSTFTTNELLEKLGKTTDSLISKGVTDVLFAECRSNGSYTSRQFFDAVKNALEKDTPTSKIISTLLDGTTCNLLQPDGKGWQKGQIKICFEFIPEEVETLVTPEKQAETDRSPLDDIRASLIESN